MKKQFILLLTAVALLVSCSNDNTNFEGETVQVSFCAEIPQAMGTRAAGDLTVNKLVCAVFDEDNKEIATLRDIIDIIDGQDPVFSPRLIKGNSYKIAFWAMKEGCYNVDDMKNISRISGENEADYDAFTYATEIVVLNSEQKAVTLARPFALLNAGISIEDWNAVTNTFGLTPTTTVVKYSGKKYFNALSGKPVETGEEEISYEMPVGGTVTVEGTTYKSIASCYILPDQAKDLKSILFTIKDQEGNAIRSNVEIPSVTLQSNYKTNIVGSILTGTVSYTISINNAFDGDKDNINIQ
jgi:hypothetical protein